MTEEDAIALELRLSRSRLQCEAAQQGRDRLEDNAWLADRHRDYASYLRSQARSLRQAARLLVQSIRARRSC